MKKTLSICLLCLFMVSITTLVAQVQVDSSKFKPYWELNIDLLPIIKQNIVPIKSIGFRRPFKQYNNTVKAFRGRIGVDYFYNYDNSSILINRRNYFYKLNLNPYLSVGLDWQKNFQKWEYYYGIELVNSLDFRRTVTANFDSNPIDKDAIVREYLNDYFYKLGLRGLVGFRRKLNDRILLGIESSIQAGFNWRYAYGERTLYFNNTWSYGGQTSFGQNYEGYMNLQPIYTLNLIYQLKKRIKNEKNNVFSNISH